MIQMKALWSLCCASFGISLLMPVCCSALSEVEKNLSSPYLNLPPVLQKTLNKSISSTTSLVNNSQGKILEERPAVIDLGREGHVFAIAETSLLEDIMGKLKRAEQSGKLEELNQKFIERAKKSILNPPAVKNLSKAERDRSWLFDPSITAKKDVFDHNNQIVVSKGTTVNPLSKLSWGEPLIFIDGTDADQVAWVKLMTGKVVLVKGPPMDIQDQIKRPVFFDQAGVLIKKFNIQHVPARVIQEGLNLKVEEICL